MLLDNIDMFIAEDVVGVNLIDLDFDGTPELLVSKQVLPENADPDSRVIEQCDVAVYSIKSGKPGSMNNIPGHRERFPHRLRKVSVRGLL